MEGRPNTFDTNGLSKLDKSRTYRLFHKYGITLQDYLELHIKQKGVCAICGKPSTKIQKRGNGNGKVGECLHVDHDHKTGKIRGLLCYSCNVNIARFKEDYKLLRMAVDYLENNSK